MRWFCLCFFFHGMLIRFLYRLMGVNFIDIRYAYLYILVSLSLYTRYKVERLAHKDRPKLLYLSLGILVLLPINYFVIKYSTDIMEVTEAVYWMGFSSLVAYFILMLGEFIINSAFWGE